MQDYTASARHHAEAHPAKSLNLSRLVRLAICGVAACSLLLFALPASAGPEGEAGHGHGHAHGEGADHDHGHDDGHGGHGGHGGMAPINWFSFDYGHGTRKDGTPYKYANPPLGFGIMNFVILMILLVKFTRKPVGSYLLNRSEEIEKNLEEAASLRDAAQAKLAEIDKKLSVLDSEVEQIKKDVVKDAEAEKVRIIKDAEAEAERIVSDTQSAMDNEIAAAKRRLERFVVSESLRVAEELITKNISLADKKKLNEQFIAQIGS